MFSRSRLEDIQHPERLMHYLVQFSPLIFAGLVTFTIIHGLMLIPLSSGGSDLVEADLPKSMMLLQGQNPYSIEPWASPYPPLLLLVDSGIIRLGGLVDPQSSVIIISETIRIAGLFADAAVAILVYLYLRRRVTNPLIPLVSAGLFLTLPALSISPLYFFHSDTFGYPILALSLVTLASRKYLIGVSLLSTATVFKIHPILALPLILVWLARTRGLRSAAPCIIASTSILSIGLALPLAIPGYAQSILGFNLSNDGSGTTLYSAMSIASAIIPPQLRPSITTLLTDQVWIAATFALYTIIVAVVWTRASKMGPADIVLLGLLAWLIPLKIEYTHYVAWAIVPLLMRGRLTQTLPVLGLLQAADTLSYWSWWPNTSPISGISTVDGLAAAGLLYRVLGLTALGFVIYSIKRKNPLIPIATRESRRSLEDLATQGTPLIVPS